MARTPNIALTQPAESELDTGRLQESQDAAQQLGAMQANYGQGRDILNQLLGQAQAFQAAGNLLQTFGVQKLAIVKENKLYQQLAGSIAPNGLALKGTWQEFCGLLGISDEKANQDIANLQAFGEEALEQMQRAGIGYRDLRKFRRMGEDDKTLLIEAAKSGDKDSLVEFAETLISKHTKEKQDLETKVTELEANNRATEQLLTAKDGKINNLARQIKKFNVDVDLPAAFTDARAAATDAVNEILTQLQKLEDIRDQALNNMQPEDEHGQEVHEGQLVNLGMLMLGGYISVEEKLMLTREAFNDTLKRHLPLSSEE